MVLSFLRVKEGLLVSSIRGPLVSAGATTILGFGSSTFSPRNFAASARSLVTMSFTFGLVRLSVGVSCLPSSRFSLKEGSTLKPLLSSNLFRTRWEFWTNGFILSLLASSSSSSPSGFNPMLANAAGLGSGSAAPRGTDLHRHCCYHMCVHRSEPRQDHVESRDKQGHVQARPWCDTGYSIL